MNVFYERVHNLCEQKGLTHAEAAASIGVSEVTFSRYLNLERKFSLQAYMAMCCLLEIPAEVLYRTYIQAWLKKGKDNASNN